MWKHAILASKNRPTEKHFRKIKVKFKFGGSLAPTPTGSGTVGLSLHQI